MSEVEGHDGSLDLADIECGLPPAGWTPDVEGEVLPSAVDVVDFDEDADS